MNKSIPIGTSDFKELIEENYYFVDKSLLIHFKQQPLLIPIYCILITIQKSIIHKGIK